MLLTNEEQRTLQDFSHSDHPAYNVLVKVIASEIEELESVRSIDPKGNMGLQALAAQKALERFESFSNKLTPASAEGKRKTEKVSQFR